jgi:hypothetical protein
VSQGYEVLDTISASERFDIVLSFDQDRIIRITKLRDEVSKDEVVFSSLSYIAEQDCKMPTI